LPVASELESLKKTKKIQKEPLAKQYDEMIAKQKDVMVVTVTVPEFPGPAEPEPRPAAGGPGAAAARL
jgi:hypothetical protein